MQAMVGFRRTDVERCFHPQRKDEKLSVLVTELHMGRAGRTGGRGLERHHRIGTEGEGGDIFG